MVLPIVHFNQPVLRQKGAPVTAFDLPLQQLGLNMIETMHHAQGIGLAAQQIGQALQFCVVDLRLPDLDFDWELDGSHPPRELFMPMIIANPVVKTLPSEKDTYEEGCLSFPDIRGDVTRPDEIEVTYQDQHGISHHLICNGLFARCIQHEVDHLNGTLFIDRMTKRTRAGLDRDLKALADQTKAASDPATS